MARMTKEELLEKLFHDDYEHLKGKKRCISESMRERIIPGSPSA